MEGHKRLSWLFFGNLLALFRNFCAWSHFWETIGIIFHCSVAEGQSNVKKVLMKRSSQDQKLKKNCTLTSFLIDGLPDASKMLQKNSSGVYLCLLRSAFLQLPVSGNRCFFFWYQIWIRTFMFYSQNRELALMFYVLCSIDCASPKDENG